VVGRATSSATAAAVNGRWAKACTGVGT
jgi:hypothetical protein